MNRISLLAVPVLALAACSAKPTDSATNPLGQTPKIDGVTVDQVLTRIKQEVGLFYSDGAKAEQNWPRLLQDLKVTPVCGNGHIAFEITAVKMDFNVATDQTGKVGAGLKIPFGPAAGGASVSPGLSDSSETAGNIDLVYTYKPLATGPMDDDFKAIRDNAIILPALDDMRDGLIRATGQKPCFQSLSPKDPDQTLTFSVAVTKDVTGTLGFNWLLLNASGSRESKNTGKNTITVSYRPIPFAGGPQRLEALHAKLNAK
jgi:hypothetical protein